MKLLLFGGTFDPPHNGHMSLLQNAIDVVQPDKIIIMPSAQPPHKNPSLTKSEMRAKMCECFLSLSNCCEIDYTEINNGGKNYTVNTAALLKQKYKNYDIYLNIGSDMLLSFDTWKSYEKLLKMVIIVCQSREKGVTAQLENKKAELERLGGKIIICSAPEMEISSTEIRENCKKGIDISGLVPSSVLDYISKHNLYT